jgi:hypothetical protein
MKPKLSSIIAVMLAALCVIVWASIFTFVFHTHKRNAPHREALLQIRDAVSMGASRDDVLAAYWRFRSNALTLRQETATDWLISMPLEFGARDWLLLIEFRDDRVTAVRVRTSDGPAPDDGPTDKETRATQPLYGLCLSRVRAEIDLGALDACFTELLCGRRMGSIGGALIG